MTAATSRRKQAESAAAASAPMIAASLVLARPGRGALHMIPIAAEAVILPVVPRADGDRAVTFPVAAAPCHSRVVRTTATASGRRFRLVVDREGIASRDARGALGGREIGRAHV